MKLDVIKNVINVVEKLKLTDKIVDECVEHVSQKMNIPKNKIIKILFEYYVEMSGGVLGKNIPFDVWYEIASHIEDEKTWKAFLLASKTLSEAGKVYKVKFDNPLKVLVEKYPPNEYSDSRWNLARLADNPAFTLDLIEKYYPYLIDELKRLSRNPNITMKFVLDHSDESWYWFELSRNPGITKKDILEFKEKSWEWYNVAINPNITYEDLIEMRDMWKHEVDEDQLFRTFSIDSMNITEKFLIRNKNKYLKYFSSNKYLKWEFVEKHITWNWNFEELSNNIFITPEIVEKYIDKSWNWNYLLHSGNIPWTFVHKYIRKFSYSTYEIISQISNITEDDIEHIVEYHNKKYPKTPEQIWVTLSYNINLPLKIIEKYIDKWNWNGISENPNLTLSFIEKYKDRIDWRILSKNTFHKEPIINGIKYSP